MPTLLERPIVTPQEMRKEYLPEVPSTLKPEVNRLITRSTHYLLQQKVTIYTNVFVRKTIEKGIDRLTSA